MAKTEIRLRDPLIREIEKTLTEGKSVEIAVRNGNVVLWSVTSKKRIEMPIA